MPMYFDEDYLFRDLPSPMYARGFLQADGYVSANNSRLLSLHISIKDICILRWLKKEMKAEQKIEKRIGGRGHEKCRIRFCRKAFVERLIEDGLKPRKTGREEIPPRILKSKHLRHWIRGYVDGDGCLRIRRSWGIQFRCVGSKKVLTQIRDHLIENANVDPSVGHVKEMNNALCHYFQYYSQNAFNLIHYLYTDLEGSYALPRKLEIARQILKMERYQ